MDDKQLPIPSAGASDDCLPPVSLQDTIIGFQTILDQTGTYIFTKDTAGRYSYVNKMVEVLFGVPFDGIIGRDDSHFFDLQRAHELCVNDCRVLELGETIAREERNVLKATGEVRIYWTVKKPIRNSLGQIIGLCGISTDITERKAMENALRESEAHLRLCQTGGGIGTWEADLRTGKQIWSESCFTLLGLSPNHEPAWEAFLSCIHPDDRQRVTDAVQAHIGQGLPYDTEYRILAADGHIWWLRSVGQLERDGNGHPSIMRGIIQDVTQHHHNQQQIEQLAQEQKAILENNLVGICTVRQRKIIWANCAFEAMLGYGKNELNGCPSRILYANESDYQSVGADYATIEKNQIVRSQYEFLRKDGQPVWVSINGALLNKETQETLWVFVDVTERKLAEIQREKLLSLLQATLESTHDAILVVDTHNTWVLYNQLFLDLWHITDDIVASKDDQAALVYVLSQLEDAEAFLRKVHELYATPDLNSFDMLKFKDGKIVERYSIPQIIDGQVVGRVWSFHDVTEREQATQALKMEVEKNLALLRNASDGIHILDFDGNSIEVSDSFCEMLGYSRHELIGMNVRRWDAAFSGEAVLQLVRRQFANPARSEFETRHRRKDGTVFDVEVSGFPFEIGGIPVLFNSSRDITERKRMEAQLRQRESYQRALLDNFPFMVWLKDTDSRLLAVNQSFAQACGYPSADLIAGKYDSDVWPADLAAQYRIDDQQVLASNTAKNSEEPIEINGERIWFETYKSPLNVEGKVIGTVGFARDITERKQAEKKILESEKKYKSLFSVANSAIFLADAESGVIIDCNPSAETLLGKPKAEIIGLHQTQLHPPDKAELYRQLFKAHVETGGDVKEDVYVVHKNGHAIPVDVSASLFEIDGARVIMGLFRNISERKQADNEMRVTATAFESQEGIAITDAEFVALRLNRAFTEMTGYSNEDAVGQSTNLLDTEHHSVDFIADMWSRIHDSGTWGGEVWVRRKHNGAFQANLIITSVKDAQGIVTNYVVTLTDITQRKATEEKVQYLAFYDPLTGLPNRQMLHDRLQLALSSSARSGNGGALLFLDLDHFKILNDTLGHDVGDKLLQQVGKRLVGCVRESDTVARLGGDEFVVILENLSHIADEAAREADLVSEKILAALNQPYQLGEHKYSNSSSIGVTLFASNQPQSRETLLKQADIAMYQAKKAGRNSLCFFDPHMQASIMSRVALEAELREAIESRQFVLHYQIQVDESGKAVGAEVLIRWQHPERGMVPPNQFIPLAEETGLIIAIGQWVLETACAQIKTWQQNPLTCHLTLSVNVSAKQLRHGGFVGQVLAVLQRYGIDPHLLRLELTESMLLDDIETTIATMNVLDEYGIQFSLDDFGTGYSCLQYLKRLPLYQLKIDQSFIRDIIIDSSDKAIVRTIIAMAHSLNLNVIAEGVETVEQRQILLNDGCRRFQGYLFGRPMAIGAFEDMLKAGA
jgi:diguanylate cyclase (GGDEF)-like protein/PAS domain S-box-containing protein